MLSQMTPDALWICSHRQYLDAAIGAQNDYDASPIMRLQFSSCCPDKTTFSRVSIGPGLQFHGLGNAGLSNSGLGNAGLSNSGLGMFLTGQVVASDTSIRG